jgi:nucleoside-diphosphate-sugar epimerase
VKSALVLGAGGFIGSHLVKRLKADGFYVYGVDLVKPLFASSNADEFIVGDLRSQQFCEQLFDRKFNHIYQLAADMGGAGYLFTGDNDADVMFNSAQINLNVANMCRKHTPDILFYSSSACVYPKENQQDPSAPHCEESSAYPANPDGEYGWEKLFSERLYHSYHRNYGLNVRIARFHNIFGPEGTWNGGKEKAPAAMCRKVAEADDNTVIEVWGDGLQTRSFLYIDDCIEGIRRLAESDYTEPINIGSKELISINDLAQMVINISGKNLGIKNIPGPVGVRGRNSDNTLISATLLWQPTYPLQRGMEHTYNWIKQMTEKAKVQTYL